jgi:hypothetical protein
MRRIVRPGEKKEIKIELIGGTQDPEVLLTKLYTALEREVQNIVMESVKGKLGPMISKDLVQYIRLLNEIRLDQEALLGELSTEELQNAAKSTGDSKGS